MAHPRIYTRTGDKGQTSLATGLRVSKASARVDTVGTVDELNSTLGVVVAHLKAPETQIKKELEKIQHDLFSIGAILASSEKKTLPELVMRTRDFEKMIDTLTENLPLLHNFILPGGGQAGSFLHLARTICRRAERRLVSLVQKEDIDQAVLIYFNRLSDLLFTLARFVNHQEKKKETIWSSKALATEDKK